MTLLEYFFKAFDFCRAERGWTSKEAAEKFGIHENDLSRYRNGKRGLKDDKRNEIADFFGHALLDFLILGRKLAEGQAPAAPLPPEMAQREADIARREAAVADREAAVALREAAATKELMERWMVASPGPGSHKEYFDVRFAALGGALNDVPQGAFRVNIIAARNLQEELKNIFALSELGEYRADVIIKQVTEIIGDDVGLRVTRGENRKIKIIRIAPMAVHHYDHFNLGEYEAYSYDNLEDSWTPVKIGKRDEPDEPPDEPEGEPEVEPEGKPERI